MVSTFVINKVTASKDMYSCVGSNLQYKIIRRNPHDILSKADPYTTTKNLVVKETDMSDYQRSEKLHTLAALRDQQPLPAPGQHSQPETDCKCYCRRYQLFSMMPPITRAKEVLCWLQGSKARSCKPPCSFKTVSGNRWWGSSK